MLAFQEPPPTTLPIDVTAVLEIYVAVSETILKN